MKIVIDIPEEEYNTGQLVHYFGCYSDKLDMVIYDGTPLPKGHGDLIDRDSLELDSDWSEYYDGFSAYSESQVRLASTIIEADKEGD